MSGNQPVIGLAPYSGYTSASAFGVEEIARLVLLDPAYIRYDRLPEPGNTEENT